MHRYHPDAAKNDPKDAILWDDCTRCKEHAENLYDLDSGKVRALWDRMVAVEVDGTEEYRTIAEAKACKGSLWLFYLLIERMTIIRPRDIFSPLVTGRKYD